MANESQNLKTFTPSVDEGLLDISPQLTLDALSGVLNPFSRQNTFRTPAREEDIRKKLKSSHIPEFTDFLLKGGIRGVDTDDLDKTYAKTDNPLIKQAILRGDDFVTGNIIRNNFYGLDLDDRNLISQAYVINARFNPFNSLGKTKKGEEVPKKIIAEFNKLKKGKKDFDAGDITQEQYEIVKGKSYRNLTEDISKGASRSLFTDPRSKQGMFLNDPYGGKPESRKAAIEAGIGPFEQGFEDIRAYDVSPLEELQLKSQYGFSPEVPSYLGSRTGTDYVPTKNQERFRVIPQRSREGFEGFEPERKIDRLKDFVSMKDSNMLYGPEGVYYNPETEQFLRGEPTYGEPPILEGYKYDPRLIELMQMQKSPAFAEQFKKNGGLTQLATGGKTMDIQQQTKNVAAQGRYGDTMLMHVNPQEVKGLASAMPLTVNPQTGQPEAFLPFLAPLLGSALGTTLLTTGGALGLTMSPALAAGLGAGLATYAQTGGSGSKALLSGLTAGFGTNAANTAAQSAVTDAATQANIAGTSALAGGVPMAPEAAATAAQQAALNAPRAATGTFEALGDTFTGGFSGFDEGAKALASGAMSPSGMVAGASLGGMGIIESQEAFARQMAENEEERKRRREEMYRNNPEPILYSANGGMTQFDDNMNEMYGPMQPMANGGQTEFFPGGATFADVGPDDITYGELPQIFAPARTAYDVNPDFMPGFAPETMYFNPATVSAPASSLTAGAAPTVEDTYTGSKGGYGGTQVSIAPQTSINPFEAYTGVAPEGLVYSQPAPPLITPEPPLTTPVTPDVPVVVEPDPVVTEPGGEFNIPNIDIPNIGNIDIPSFGGMSVLDQINLYGLNNDTPNLDLLSDNNLLPNLDLLPNNNLNIGNTNFVPNLDFLSDNNLGFADFKPQDFNVSMSRAEGGPTNIEEMQNDPLTKEVALYLLGQSNDEKSLNLFLEKYGNEAFMKLREMVLQTVAPNSQTEGLIAGAGNGGMDDDISGTIGNKQEIAVSQDEFIVPADVVSMLGDGSSDAGSKELYDMMDRVRQEKTGTTKQAPKLANAGGLLPA